MHNIDNFMRDAMPIGYRSVVANGACERKLAKIGAKIMSHGRYLAFYMVEIVCRDRYLRKS